jgi:hypothetical protein
MTEIICNGGLITHPEDSIKISKIIYLLQKNQKNGKMNTVLNVPTVVTDMFKHRGFW